MPDTWHVPHNSVLDKYIPKKDMKERFTWTNRENDARVEEKKTERGKNYKVMKKKVVVGMSGGVDSSVAAYLLKEAGYEVIGITMQMWRGEDAAFAAADTGNCEGEGMTEDGGFGTAARDAKKVADLLGIPHYTMDFTKEFKRSVVDYFVEEYLQGRTPNPCNVCNRYVKWEALLERCKKLGADYIATGHYARIERLPNGRYTVRNAAAGKDQTYALYYLTQEQLAHTLMPVGSYAKEEIREMAKQLALPVAAKPDSQDICFIPDGDYGAFLQREAGERLAGAGSFVGTDGTVLGEHKGIVHYTIGQRKGLHLAMGRPVFVTAIRPKTNEVVIGENEDLYTDTLFCDRVNYMGAADFAEPVRAKIKIRYAHAGTMGVLEKQADGRIKCTFDIPVRAVTPGQAAVFYQDDYVLGGGTIL